MNGLQTKRDFTPEEITKIVTALGSDPPRSAPNGGLIFQTICHNPPHTGSEKLYYYPDSGLFHCYTHCADSFDVYELIMRSQHCSFRAALSFVQQTLGIVMERKTGFETKTIDDWSLLERYGRIKQTKILSGFDGWTVLPSSLIDFYSPACPVEWQQEGITEEAARRFQIRSDVSRDEIIIPHYNLEGQLVGIRSRSFDPEVVASGNKYMPTRLEGRDFRHALKYNLYGLNVIQDVVRRTGKIVLAEAEKSALQSYSYYGECSFTAAVCGSNISNYQRDLIVSLGVQEIFLAFDKEYHEAYTEESDRYSDKILKLAGLFTPYARVYVLWDVGHLLDYQDSPFDKGKEVLEQLMKRKFEITTET